MAAQLEDMMQAKKFIFLEYHAIEMAESFQALRKVLMAKAREGVEIRILYDDAGCIGFLNPRLSNTWKVWEFSVVCLTRLCRCLIFS